MSKTRAMRRTGPRGFAMIVAIALVAVVGLALAAVMALSHIDLRRTTEAARGAQLRQMLAAGERAARQQLDARGSIDGTLKVGVPAALAADGGAVELRVERQDEPSAPMVVNVEATLGGSLLTQVLRYERGATGWRLVSADLARPTAKRP